MARRTTGVYIVPDDAKIVRTSEIVKEIQSGKSLREVSREIGVSPATISRALREAGYEIRQTVTLELVNAG